jgi:epoxyqueuosine reductase
MSSCRVDAAKAREIVAEMAAAEGFPLVRFAPAAPLLEARAVALAREADGHLAGMGWMTPEWLTRATDPGAFLVRARTVVLVALPYARPSASWPADGAARGRVAQYAQGRDYHRVFETKLRRIARQMREELGASARPTVDYGPLLERPLGALSGMGWLGKSTMLLVPGMGPWVLLGAIATDLELAADEPLKKSCGSCRRCIVACPTGAISPEGSVLDARLCISYHTIENRGPIPRELRPKFKDWVFGCDDCLTSCPVGAATATPGYPEFAPTSEDDSQPPLVDLLALTEEAFKERFRGRAVTRAKRDGLVRNACIALGNVGGPRELPALLTALSDASPLVRGHAAWAVGELVARLGLPRGSAAAALRARLAAEADAWVREELENALGRLPTRAHSNEGSAHGT